MTDQTPTIAGEATGGQRRIVLLGATGTIGQATLRALVAQGCHVVCTVRPASRGAEVLARTQGAEMRMCDVADPASLDRDGLRGERFDAIVSCMASRTGAPRDAWAVDYHAHKVVLDAAVRAGIGQFILLSAICVQKPLLAFQHAKLAFEKDLIASGLTHAIVRPTAFFKSLSGQFDRLRQGKRFLVFGDGRLTACKPISDDDLAAYLVRCLNDTALHDRILPIGGPGPAITPIEQGERLFALLGTAPRFARVPVAMLDTIIGALAVLGTVSPAIRDKAELARIGRYYATESMLLMDPETGRYDADATPSTGTETLFDFYEKLVAGDADADRGAHAVF